MSQSGVEELKKTLISTPNEHLWDKLDCCLWAQYQWPTSVVSAASLQILWKAVSEEWKMVQQCIESKSSGVHVFLEIVYKSSIY